jgi:hypothetical protein
VISHSANGVNVFLVQAQDFMKKKSYFTCYSKDLKKTDPTQEVKVWARMLRQE